MAEVNATVSEHEDEIKKVNSTVSEHENEINTFDDHIDILSDNIGTNTGHINTLKDNIASNMARWIEEGAFKRETLYGISLLNEPAGWWDKVRLGCLCSTLLKVWSACTDEFYPGGYEVVR